MKKYLLQFITFILSTGVSCLLFSYLSPYVFAFEPATSGLRIVGTHFVDGSGHIRILRGAARWSLEFGCGDGHFHISDFQAMQSWGMNTVKFPLNANTYLFQNNGCGSYRQTVDTAIKNAESVGMYVILDLHWVNPMNLHGFGEIYSMPDQRALQFWSMLATQYANDDKIMFEPYSEPHPQDCNTWRNGSTLNTSDTGQAYSYQSVGMQQLVTTIRNAAPNRIILVSGSGWSNNLTCVTQTPLSVSGGNIGYQAHWYQTPPTDFAPLIDGADANAPVIAGELGINSNLNYQVSVMDYFEKNQTGYLAWAWSEVDNVGGNLLARNGWNGTASPLGQQVKDYMQHAASIG